MDGRCCRVCLGMMLSQMEVYTQRLSGLLGQVNGSRAGASQPRAVAVFLDSSVLSPQSSLLRGWKVETATHHQYSRKGNSVPRAFSIDPTDLLCNMCTEVFSHFLVV